MEHADLRERAERARRLARAVTDTHMRLSLEALADEYEAQLPHDSDDDDESPSVTLRTRH